MNDSFPEFYCPFSDECYECCLDTEMTLSNFDVKKIEEGGYNRRDFLEEKEGFLILQNFEGHCYFLKDKRCSIYKIRPQGCRFYPLIYDFEVDEILIDELCTNHTEFDADDYDSISEDVIIFVNEIVEEKEKRLKKKLRKK
ncbi:MAG: YkgJ family cysteine cluster protein [Asgard group archaeon]|nr:YkgJ family cysteine cluster protein [Asgard group archaeon]